MPQDAGNEITAARVKEIRTAAGMNQKTFWASLGCLASTGSRYESGGLEIPPTVRLLIQATYVDKAGEAAKFRRAAARAAKILGEVL